MDQTLLLWGGFALLIVAMLALDIGLFHRKAHVIGMREALLWTAVWITLALAFNIGVWYWLGSRTALEFLTGYLVEKALSIDNVFVFILIFSYFETPAAYHHKVLFWGIVGAIVARTIFIVGGLALLATFHWTMYVFGAFLLGTGISMMVRKREGYTPDRNPVIRLARRWFRITDHYENGRFFVRHTGRWSVTPLFIVLIAVESTDIIFAVDSIPAVFAITREPFIVFSSNIFAMLGLRALYFAVAGFMRSFHYLHYGFASIIVILGIKMLLSDVYKMPAGASLGLIVVILTIAVIASLLRPRREDLKRMLERSERRGLFSFRRLLLLENVFDLGSERVCRAMRGRDDVHVLRAEAGWPDNRHTMIQSRFSRYPLVTGPHDEPRGFVHVKDLLYLESPPRTADEWGRLARPHRAVREDTTLEALLIDFQRHHQQMALVFDTKGAWTGLVTLEDVIEEIVGDVGDEFEAPSMELPALTPARVTIGLQAESLEEAVTETIVSTTVRELGLSSGQKQVAMRDAAHTAPSYVGHGVAAVVATSPPIRQPALLFGRSESGVSLPGQDDRIHLFFVLLLPTGAASMQQVFTTAIAASIESDYVRERLMNTSDPGEIVEVISDGLCVAQR
jgi:tellurite resistance protein TerC